ncbi:MAG: helix-turn-helix domain-containing protein [Flavobacteriales bacterium]
MKEKIRIDYPLKVAKYTKAHLEYLIKSSAEESVHIEYKAAGALEGTDYKKHEISKDVSAMANADGGIIVYGISEEDHIPKNYSFINGNSYSKEWLEQVINSKIKRRIPELTIDVIRLGNKITQSIYVVKIPRSQEAPHMASDGRYYKRYNFESKRMEEYEVRDLFRRTGETSLKLMPCEFKVHPIVDASGNLKKVKLQVILDVKNESKHIEEVYKTILRIPKGVYKTISGNADLKQHFRKFQPDYALLNIPASTPLFPKEVNTLANFELQIEKQHLAELARSPMKIKFYYSNGVYQLEYFLDLQLKIKGKMLSLADFA